LIVTAPDTKRMLITNAARGRESIGKIFLIQYP
jgi:hypothetical protein